MIFTFWYYIKYLENISQIGKIVFTAEFLTAANTLVYAAKTVDFSSPCITFPYWHQPLLPTQFFRNSGQLFS